MRWRWRVRAGVIVRIDLYDHSVAIVWRVRAGVTAGIEIAFAELRSLLVVCIGIAIA